jgi:hypothetical protein
LRTTRIAPTATNDCEHRRSHTARWSSCAQGADALDVLADDHARMATVADGGVLGVQAERVEAQSAA